MENIVEEIANKIGSDPLEVRKINFYQKEISVLNNALIKRKDVFVNESNKDNSPLEITNKKIYIQKDANEIIVQIDNENNDLNELNFTIKGQEDTLYAKSFTIGEKKKLKIQKK